MTDKIKIIIILLVFILLLMLVYYMDNIIISSNITNNTTKVDIKKDIGSIINKNLEFKNKAVGNGKNSSDIGL